MAVTLGDGLFGVTILVGLALCWLGTYCYRRWNEPGVTAFSAVVVLLGLGATSGGVIALVRDPLIPNSGTPLWASVAMTGWVLAMIPWILFALQYTGRYTQFRRRTVAAIAIPPAGVVTLLLAQTVHIVTPGVVFSVLGTIIILYVFALSVVGGFLLLRTTAEYGHLSVALGVSLTVGGLGPLLALNFVSILAQETNTLTVITNYLLAFLVPATGFLLAVFRYDMFQSTPAAGALGERAIPRETDDLVFVVDRAGRVIKLNETAATRLGVDRTTPLGDPFEELLGETVDELADTETVELETAVGKRKFDPQVTAFTDQHGRRLGRLVSLRDVTERELRKQRLEVLNRVLRHNLRNRVDVIKSRAEALKEHDSDHAVAIRDSADGLASLSAKARATDKLLSEPATGASNDLVDVVRALVDTDHGSEEVTLDLPETAPLVTDWGAVRAAVESAIENALEHAESSVAVAIESNEDGYTVTVADDGPGIPESELASIDAESERPLQHGTGLGLWKLKWAVTKLNGELSFDTTDGTTVRITVPDQSDHPESV